MKLFFKKITLLFLTVIVTSCSNDSTCIHGEGTITTKTIEALDFYKIDISIASQITISQGETYEVKVTGNPNIIAELKTSVVNNMLEIDLESGCYSYNKLAIEITIPELSLIRINGSSKVVINDFYDQSNLEVSISGSGQIFLNKFEGITNLNVDISGSGSFETNNYISTLNNSTVNISGSGRFDGYETTSNIVSAQISGSGKAYITATESLEATISGSGKMYYKGNPVITQTINGSGRLINAN